MKWLLNVAYLSALTLLSPFILWRMLRHGRYRRGWAQKLFGELPDIDDSRPVIWFHAVSVGEVLQLQKIVDDFRTVSDNECCILISTSTDTGFDLANDRFPQDVVCWFPLDFSWAVSRALRRVRPAMVVLVELELWPNFLSCCHQLQIKTALVNARMSDRSFSGYQRFRYLMAPVFRGFSVVAAQTPEYAERLIQLGTVPAATSVTGSVKFDGVLTDRRNRKTQAIGSSLGVFGSDSNVVFVAGSTQAPEEQLILDAWKQLQVSHPGLRLVLVPRHQERFDEVANLILDNGCQLIRRTQSNQLSGIPQNAVVLLDTIGELSACWGLADIAFVGGSFGSRGGQNMLEPAAFGAAVMFGPNTWNFRDIVSRLLESDSAVQLQSPAELVDTLKALLGDPVRRGQLGQNAQQFVLKQQGALRKTVELLYGAVVEDDLNKTEGHAIAA